MSSGCSSISKGATKSKPAAKRSPSASEIARNIGHFETWCSYQGCEQVLFSDLPEDLKDHTADVFTIKGCLPLCWVDEKSKEFRLLSSIATREMIAFISDAHKHCPTLFSADLDSKHFPELFQELVVVFSAWRQLQRMRLSKEKYSEASYVAVYNVFRMTALSTSTHRMHCTLSLPQPISGEKLSSQAIRILNTKSAIPDCAVFIPNHSIRALSHSAKSPFKVLKAQSSVTKSGSPSKGSSFRFQSTPCAALPVTPGFEFTSSVWEDKKPVHQYFEDAYRQNRMSTASAVRHLHSLGVKAPVIGLLWTSGRVRAHVDWCDSEIQAPAILSAPYPSPSGDNPDELFHEWLLHQPADILQVFFLIKNIDAWTMGRFRERVVSGVNGLLESVVKSDHKYQPWKRVGTLSTRALAVKVVRKENVNVVSATGTSSAASTPPKRKVRSGKR